ncbi:hypothetical protein CsSME_00016296 [Camellia sinensis var. sinensis]|uniref:Uncharacterized protein n=2 Tax=Camellia sinensis TaxID=4442 RepID=A0A7J7HNC7_CAMSI|nr:hypothetical protein HYC85_007085 [Camellia sinensis]THG03379.1 hypothetical protein TEA_021925 [Camellia sinensis var. sinensis]
MDFYYITDNKWNQSKIDSTSPMSSLLRSISQKSTSSKSPLLRSFSHKPSSNNHKPPLSKSSSFKSSSFSRSSSQKSSSSSPPSKSPLSRSSSQKCSEFARKCNSLAKEQRARLYIMKRCVTMLVCWNKNGDC